MEITKENNIDKINLDAILHKRGSAADLKEANPLLLAGEVIYESDTGKSKLGDGTKHWNELSYADATVVVDDLSAINDDNINSYSDKALSAKQGKTLANSISNIKSHDVIDSFDSSSTTNGLSAAKGKDLNDRLFALENITVIDCGVVTSNGD